jgi:regulatory protein
MRIDRLSASPDRAGRYRAEFEDGSVLRLYRQTVEDFGLYAGMELEESELAALQEAAGLMSAKMRAIRIVTATDVSKKDLRQRLIQKGENPEQADAAVAWMDDLDLIDDRRTAELIVSRCAAKGYGLARAKQALYEKRIPKQYWEEALADYPDQSEYILEYLRGHLLEDGDSREVKRCIDALLRRGHNYRQVRRCLEQLSVDTDEFPED